jgi:hypothetical protein
MKIDELNSRRISFDIRKDKMETPKYFILDNEPYMYTGYDKPYDLHMCWSRKRHCQFNSESFKKATPICKKEWRQLSTSMNALEQKIYDEVNLALNRFSANLHTSNMWANHPLNKK